MRMNRRYFEKVAKWCYYPACEMFLDMLDDGFKLGLGFSLSFLWQLRRWDAVLAERFRRLVAHPNCELVGVDPYHSFAFAIDIKLFQREMLRGKDYAEEFFEKEIRITDTTEMVMNNEIYYALLKSGYRAGMLDGRKWVLEWREPTHLYRHGERELALFCRHHQLSDDVGYRFSNRPGPGIRSRLMPTPSTCAAPGATSSSSAGTSRPSASTTASTPGSSISCARCPASSSDGACTASRPARRVDQFGKASLPDLPLPEFGTTWAGSGGMEFFLGNPSQQAIFRLMHSVLNKARLTGNRTLVDLALWLLQSDNLHLIQWAGRSGSEAEVSAYFTPERMVGSWPGQDPDRAAARVHELRPGDG